MTDHKIVAPLYPNTKKQYSALKKLDGMLLDASQCLVEQIEGKVRRICFLLFDNQTVRARTSIPYGDAPLKSVSVKRKGGEWGCELTYSVPEHRRVPRKGAEDPEGEVAVAALDPVEESVIAEAKVCV